MTSTSYQDVLKRLRELRESEAKIPNDHRPLHKRLANDIDLINKLEPYSEGWNQAWVMIELEMKELSALEKTREILEDVAYEVFLGWQIHYRKSGAGDNEAWGRMRKAKEILQQLDLWPPKVKEEVLGK